MIASLFALAVATIDAVVIDDKATLRWQADNREIALFGANYCLPTALDYRAAGYVGADRKALVRQDMAHFQRMGWDGLRLSFWGDWEATDRDGNLLQNDHLDLLDYVVAEGAKRGIKFLLSPIVTYDARWPEMKEYPEAHGLSRYHEKGKLGLDPAAIKAQQNYLRQLLNHVNPYTKQALKDEPSIVFVEMINEPWHHANDPAGSVRYIDALVQAVRDTGCTKPTFHNLSQDFKMIGPINDSRVDGHTYAWYPTGLNANFELRGNFLRYLDDYPPMKKPEIRRKPTLVYEFDLPDTDTGYGFPAMVREFRKTGAQFAAMFSYDMLATAPTNLGWTTHLLNLVYTPKKAASAVIAGEAMRRLPRFQDYGVYPMSKRFGDFRVDEREDLAELVARDAFMYSNDTKSRPPAPRKLRRIVGFGSSPVVRYAGKGVYFLDRIEEGRWRLEVYPDALQVDDPYRDPKKENRKFRLIHGRWPMTVSLPDLGNAFRVEGLDRGNSTVSTAREGRFEVKPGVYLLSAKKGSKPVSPEFVCPPSDTGAPDVALSLPPSGIAGQPFLVEAQVVAEGQPKSVVVEDLGSGTRTRLRAAGPYRYQASLRTGTPGVYRYRVLADGVASPPSSIAVTAPSAPVVLLDPARDAAMLSVSRSGEGRNAVETLVPGSAPDRQALNFRVPTWVRQVQEDFSVSAFIGDRATLLPTDGHLTVRLRAKSEGVVVHLTLVDQAGNAWSTPLRPTKGWQTLTVPLKDLKPSRWAMLPQAYPGTWSYWADSLPGAKLELRKLERLQLSLRRADLGPEQRPDLGVELESIAMTK
jgi:hypothetical protein